MSRNSESKAILFPRCYLKLGKIKIIASHILEAFYVISNTTVLRETPRLPNIRWTLANRQAQHGRIWRFRELRVNAAK